VESVSLAPLEDLAARAPADVGDSPPYNSDIGRMSSDNSDTAPSPSDIPHSGDCGMHNSHRIAPASDIPHSGDSPSDNSHIAASPPHNSHIAVHDADISHRPGDDFNRRGDVRAILVQSGWALVKPGDNEHWRRPGKSSGNHSATLNDGVFYVFSANSAPFEPNRAYSPFAVCTLMNHGDDYEAAARSLREAGYGDDPALLCDPGVDISGIMRMSVAQGASPSYNAHPGQMSDSPVARASDVLDELLSGHVASRTLKVWICQSRSL
jgi:hypothetical protein